jgi:hypothetical protein
MKVIDLDARDRKAELTLLVKMEELTSAGAKRDFAKEIGIEWDEYLRLCRKYRVVLDRYRKQKRGER